MTIEKQIRWATIVAVALGIVFLYQLATPTYASKHGMTISECVQGFAIIGRGAVSEEYAKAKCSETVSFQ